LINTIFEEGNNIFIDVIIQMYETSDYIARSEWLTIAIISHAVMYGGACEVRFRLFHNSKLRYII
jgi:hypothetical protein